MKRSVILIPHCRRSLVGVHLFGLLFYIQALGMRVVKKADRPEQKVILNSYCMFSCGVQVL